MTEAEIELKVKAAFKEYKDLDAAQDAEVTSSGVYFSEQDCMAFAADFALQMMGEKEKVVDLHEDTETCEQCEKRFAIEFMRLDEEGYWFCKTCILN